MMRTRPRTKSWVWLGTQTTVEMQEADQRLIYVPPVGPGRATARTFVIATAVEPEGIANDLRRIAETLRASLSVEGWHTQRTSGCLDCAGADVVATFCNICCRRWLFCRNRPVWPARVQRDATRRRDRCSAGAGRYVGQILRMVLGEATAITLIGALAGAPLALWSRAITGHLLPEISATPASAVFAGLLVLLAVAALSLSLQPEGRNLKWTRCSACVMSEGSRVDIGADYPQGLSCSPEPNRQSFSNGRCSASIPLTVVVAACTYSEMLSTTAYDLVLAYDFDADGVRAGASQHVG